MDTPQAPDPKATAQAQVGLNIDTANTSQMTNMVNQVGPDGSLTYNQTGTNSYTGSDGKTYSIPQYTATQQLSAANQGIYDTNQITKQNVAQIGADQSARIGDLLGTPVDLGNEAVESRLYDLGSKRLDPQFAAQEEALRSRLSNSGIQAGSAAFDREMSNFSQGRNDAYNSLLLSGRGQAVQEQLAQRNQPINEITALLSGSQVSQPNFVNTPQTQVAGVDYAGMVGDNYKAEVTSNNAMLGGLFGLASSPFKAFNVPKMGM